MRCQCLPNQSPHQICCFIRCAIKIKAQEAAPVSGVMGGQGHAKSTSFCYKSTRTPKIFAPAAGCGRLRRGVLLLSAGPLRPSWRPWRTPGLPCAPPAHPPRPLMPHGHCPCAGASCIGGPPGGLGPPHAAPRWGRVPRRMHGPPRPGIAKGVHGGGCSMAPGNTLGRGQGRGWHKTT